MSRLAVIITDPETTLITFSPHILYSTYISRVFNFVNLESFAKFIQLKIELLRHHTHEQHEFAKLFSMNSFKAAIYLRKFRPAKYKRIRCIVREFAFYVY